MIKLLLILVLMTNNIFALDKVILFKCLEEMEGSHDLRIHRLPNGIVEVGRYCITESFYIDSRIGNNFKGCTNKEYSQQVILRYWKRYCSKELNSGDVFTLAAKFRGGPTGTSKQVAREYAKKVVYLYNLKIKGNKNDNTAKK